MFKGCNAHINCYGLTIGEEGLLQVYDKYLKAHHFRNWKVSHVFKTLLSEYDPGETDGCTSVFDHSSKKYVAAYEAKDVKQERAVDKMRSSCDIVTYSGHT